jgi:ribosome-associated protein
MTQQVQNRDFTPEFIFTASRSGGPGGQNVNKVSSKVELRFHVDQSQLLTTEEKQLIKEKLATKITSEGFLQIIAQAERSQLLNKQAAVKKFYHLLTRSLTKPKVRKPTKPTAASVNERLQRKKKDSDKKNNRQQRQFNTD